MWSKEETCMWLWCGNPRTIFVASRAQAMLFIAKAAVRYARGQPFAHIAPVYKFGCVERTHVSCPASESEVSYSECSLTLYPAVSDSELNTRSTTRNLDARALLAEVVRLRAQLEQAKNFDPDVKCRCAAAHRELVSL